MFTRREEDITILEIEEKNTELLLEWAEGKEGDRSGANRGQENYRDGGGEEREVTGGVQPG